MTHLVVFLLNFGIITMVCQMQEKALPSVCGCDVLWNYHAYDLPYEAPGECRYYCMSTSLSYYSEHMTKEIRVLSRYDDDADDINLILCNDNSSTSVSTLTKPVILYFTSYEPIDWIISSDNEYILDNIIIEEIYVEYYDKSDGKSTVALASNFSQSIDPTIVIKHTDDWHGYGDDNEGNIILQNVKKRYNLELYSFCGVNDRHDLSLCVGEEDIAGNKYPTDDEYKECEVPESPLWENVIAWVGFLGGFYVMRAQEEENQRRLDKSKRRREYLEKERIRKK
eukprot:505132_1